MVRSLRRRKEAGGNDQAKVTAGQRNSLSGKSHLPRTGVTLCVNPAHNGEPLTGLGKRCRRRNAVGSPLPHTEVWPRND